MNTISVPPLKFVSLIPISITLIGLYCISLNNYLLFHSLSEFFSIVIAFGIFIIAWNSRKFLDNNYLLFLGIIYLFVGGIDLFHTLSYKGMGVFDGYGANLPTQLWIAARYMESISLLIAPFLFLISRKINFSGVFTIYLIITLLLFVSIFTLKIFPDCFIEGSGLTAFKKLSEYIISCILLGSVVVLFIKKNKFNSDVFKLIVAATVFTICGELAFTFYVSVYDFSNLVGHFFKIISFILIYKAIVETSFKRPYDILFRNLKNSETKFRKINDQLVNSIDSMPIAYILWNTDNQVVEWNKAAEKIFGYPKEEILGKNAADYIVPEEARHLVGEVLKQLKAGEVAEYSERDNNIGKDGKLISCQWYNTPLADESDNIYGFITLAQDITERMQAESEIQESNSLLSSIIESTDNIIIFALDTNYNYLSFNTAHKIEMKKAYDADIEIGQSISSYLPREDDRLKSEINYKRVLKGERFVQVQEYGETDSRFWYELIFNPIINSSNQVTGFTVFVSNITDRKLVEEALKQSDKHLRASQRIAHLGSWRLNLATNKVVWTEELYKMYGFDPSLPPPPYTEHMKLFTPESWEKLSTSLARTVETGIPYELELETVKEDGNNGWMWVRGEAVKNSTGKVVELWGAAQDITGRKQEAERYKKTIESSIDGFWITDMKGEFLEVNEAYTNMIGYNRDELLKMSIMDVEALEHPEETKKRIETIIKDGSDRFESKHRHKKGHIIDVEVSTIFTQDSGGLFFVFLRDITERNRMEERLQQAQKMESIGNLAGGIAHDFNNILFPIIGMSEMLLEDLPEDSLEYENAEEIFHAGKRAGDLVNQILTFSRQSEHKMTPVRVQNVLKEVLKLSRSTIPVNIDIQQNIQQSCGLIMADPTQIHQIAMNLITNALHAIEEKNGVIDIELKEITIDESELSDSNLLLGEYVRLSVSDNGIGIPQKAINSIFEPYFTTKEKGKGTGLGLAVVYGIVKEHGGNIKVQSKVGEGTTFNVLLPLMKKSSDIVSIDKVSDAVTGTESILLVDDELSVAKLESQMLTRLGYHLTMETNSEDALSAFKSSPNSFDLVISDMTMPNMTGDQLAKEILSIKPNVPIIICTGFSERINKEQAEAIGVKGFLMKPVVKFDMAQMVRNVLDEAEKS